MAESARTQADQFAPLAGAAGPRAYLAGAGGCGMRGLAGFLLANGWEVWGSDRRPFAAGDPLLAAGLQPLEEGEAPPAAVSLAVRSAAVPESERGFAGAAERGARPLRYAELLGLITGLRPTLAVAGSHGKTTCTAWIAHGLRAAGRPVGFLVGGSVPQLGGSSDWGDPGQILVAESCEYDRSFHHLRPHAAALTNVDAEHPDTYPGGLEEVLEAFRVFLGRVEEEGVVFAGPEAPELAAATRAAWRRAPALPGDWRIGLPGAHNRRNAALVAAVLRAQGLREAEVRAAIASFRGAARRMEEVGWLGEALVVSDYAHHPSEVAATLDGVRERYPRRRTLVAFQPHQASRFDRFRAAFADALRAVDRLVLFEIYRTRDPEELRPSSAELLPLLPESLRGSDRTFLAAGPAEAEAQLRAWARAGDLVLCLGAGDIDGFARRLVG